MYAESAERDSLAREGEIRRAWVVNEPARLVRETRWEVDDRVRKRKLQFMLADFRARERGLEGGGEAVSEQGEFEEEERQVKRRR
jgi:hypothetical protein